MKSGSEISSAVENKIGGISEKDEFSNCLSMKLFLDIDINQKLSIQFGAIQGGHDYILCLLVIISTAISLIFN